MATITKSPKAKIKHKFSDGTEITGTIDQITTAAKALGLKVTGISGLPKGYYPSDSKGVMRISDMNDLHIRRALIKRSKDFFSEIFDTTSTNRSFLKKYTSLTNDSVIVDLFNELSKRG